MTTVIHELSHQHLFVPGQVGFNESFANFVGRVGAARFFCTREGSGPDSIKCQRALARWRDYQRFSDYLDGLRRRAGERLRRRGAGLRRQGRPPGGRLRRTRSTASTPRWHPELESFTFAGFRNTPLNNATLMSRIRYYNKLRAFDAFLATHGGDLVAALDDLKARANAVDDPFSLLPTDLADDVGVARPGGGWHGTRRDAGIRMRPAQGRRRAPAHADPTVPRVEESPSRS